MSWSEVGLSTIGSPPKTRICALYLLYAYPRNQN